MHLWTYDVQHRFLRQFVFVQLVELLAPRIDENISVTILCEDLNYLPTAAGSWCIILVGGFPFSDVAYLPEDHAFVKAIFP